MTTPDPTDRSTTPTAASVDRSVPVAPPVDGTATAADGADGAPGAAAAPDAHAAAAQDSATVPEPPAAPESAVPASSAVPEPPAAAKPAAASHADPARRSTRSGHRRAEPETGTARSGRGVYLVPALLVVALVLLVVGLVTGTSAWLAASLAASVLAAVLLVLERLVQRRRAAATVAPAATADASPSDPAVVDLDAPAIDPDDPEAVWVVDGRPRYHVRGCETISALPGEPIPRAQALEDGFVACSLCDPGTSGRAQRGR